MKQTWQDIFKFIKSGIVILLLVVCLAGCDKMSGTSGPGLSSASATQEELAEQQRSCWQGNLLAMFYNAMGEASLKAYPSVTQGALPFMMVAFAIWLCLRILRHVSSINEESPAEVWTEVGRMATICLFCGILASSNAFLLYTLNTFIFPIYYTFLEYSERILQLATDDVRVKGQYISSNLCLIYENESLTCTSAKLEKIAQGATSFPSGPSTMMQCLVCTAGDRLQLGFALAKDLIHSDYLSGFFIGIFLYIIFTFVKISFVFYMVDSIFRMAIIVIILPFLILAVPFKATRQWSSYGFKVIINSSAIMMCISIVMTMSMLALQVIIEENKTEFGNPKLYQEFGVVALATLAVGFLVLKSTGLAVSMANSLVGGDASTEFQKKIAKLAATVVKAAAVAISAGTGKVLTSVIDRIEKLRKIKEKIQKASRKSGNMMKKLAGRDRTAQNDQGGEG